MPVHFLNSPAGVICLVIICATSLINIYAHWIDDGLFGRLLYMAAAVTAGAGLVHYVDNDIPYHIATTLLIIFTLKSVRNLSTRTLRYYRYRRTIQHGKKHLR